MHHLETIRLELSELEAMRLCDLIGHDQEVAGIQMDVSRGTIQRLLKSGRAKVLRALVQSSALRFETLGAIISMLNEIAVYDLPWDYVKQRGDFVMNLTLDGHRDLAQQYITPDRMIYLVVGDGATQLDQLNALGLGAPILLDRDGSPAGGN